MAGGLHQGDDALELLPVEEPLRLPDKDLVALVILCRGEHHGLLGLEEAVEDARRGLHLPLQGPVGHEADVEHHEEPVNVHLPIRHKSLVELFLQTCKELTFLKSFFLASATDFVPW